MLIEYIHTQPAWVIRILFGVSILILVGLLVWNIQQNLIGIAVGGPVIAIFLVCFWSLTVKVSDTHLSHYFSWGFWKRSYPLHEISSVNIASSQWYYGYGIRYVGPGWMYNVSGSDVLLVTMKSGDEVRIGTDDVDTLFAILSEKIPS